MTEKDKEKWDARYLDDAGSMEVSPIVERFWQLAPVGNALDIACGNGRNSLFLADRGFRVDAVDISSVVTSRLRDMRETVNVICTDLDVWTLPTGRYDLVVNVRFLDRRLFPLIVGSLKENGVLIF